MGSYGEPSDIALIPIAHPLILPLWMSSDVLRLMLGLPPFDTWRTLGIHPILR